MKLVDHFFTAPICIQDLTEKGPECIFFRKNPSATHSTILLWFKKRMRDKVYKEFAHLLEGLLLEQGHFFSKSLLG